MTKKAISCSVGVVWFALAFWLLTAHRMTTAAGVFNSQGGQEDKPVEQTRKNVQVLKGLPSSQLFPLMNFVSASLGVRCAYCHVNNGGDNWVWESDDKERKRTARRMMQMVIGLNKNNQSDFRDSGITCFTCHRGQTDVQRLPPLPLTVSGHEDNSVKGEKRAEALPPANQILTKYVEAVGGRGAVAKLKTFIMKGTREATQGRVWPLEIYIKQHDKFLFRVTVPQQGVISQAFNGAAGWLENSQERRAMTVSELSRLKQTAELYEVIKIKEPFPAAVVTGKEKIGEREAYVIESTSAAGVKEKLYFDVQTGLLLRKLTLADTVLVPIPEQIDFEDYREVDGVKLPFTIRISNIDTYFSSTRRFTEIRHDVPLDDAQFNLPAARK
ncbi:MAG TPA: c-type cytochrome [Pyrinomonadaceae bacterium]|nr:c-type cytochrome [Pyrinomonadaceae bacterium]